MSHSHSHSKAASPEELIGNIQKLMDQVEGLINRPDNEESSNGVGDRISDLRDRLSAATDRVKGAYTTARRTVVSGAKKTDKHIRSHPYQSALVALGLGVLVGSFLRRGSGEEED